MMQLSTPSLADALAGNLPVDGLRGFNGFGGLHGGLLAAALIRQMRESAPDGTQPVELTITFVRPVVVYPTFATDVVHAGRSMSVVAARASVDEKLAATAQAVFASPSSNGDRPWQSPFPAAITTLEESDSFTVPPELVPIASRMEIRPATPALPFSGSDEPELCAWIRLTEDVADPLERLTVLADALAPAYFAVLHDLRVIPTARMTIHYAHAAATMTDDWVLVQSRTVHKGTDSWLTESTNVWAQDGTQLATATQLRRLR